MSFVKTLQTVCIFLFPIFILLSIVFCLLSKKDITKAFKTGALNGFETIFEIIPSIVLITVATSLLKQTGALLFLTNLLTPLTSFLKIPPELSGLIIMRPVSGSGSVALLKNILETAGADSFAGLVASTIAASTETTLYTVSIYFGSTNVKKTALPLFVGIMADVFTVFFSIFIVSILL